MRGRTRGRSLSPRTPAWSASMTSSPSTAGGSTRTSECRCSRTRRRWWPAPGWRRSWCAAQMPTIAATSSSLPRTAATCCARSRSRPRWRTPRRRWPRATRRASSSRWPSCLASCRSSPEPGRRCAKAGSASWSAWSVATGAARRCRRRIPAGSPTRSRPAEARSSTTRSTSRTRCGTSTMSHSSRCASPTAPSAASIPAGRCLRTTRGTTTSTSAWSAPKGPSTSRTRLRRCGS
jgi:hypothetical protein